ncbi:retrovirus-related pol polyprotein from transposon RE2 [Citrus sinensis]|uniref:Retrovirus-related pol polyprotein from transposon RE2 n=1 Tax=Citrus sinensis TaxID=2711 RepID=A0ACB8IID5_CITSI|nr:retrovirus-related pol polyprotein from transposon RE2 [Citrus sinensis]
MASSSNITTLSNSTNANQTSQISFSFSNPIKLDRSNFLIWRKQVLTSIRGNRLEDFISENQIIPEQHIIQTTVDGSVQKVDNPAYINWRAQDQILLGWLLSSVNEDILSSILNCDNSRDAWRSIEKQFGAQSEAKIMQLRYELNVLGKESMSVEEYCLKVKILADKLACAGSPMSERDLLMQVLNGLGTGYLDLASIITANKMSYDDAYALLLTHEARLEQTGAESDDNIPVCQICHKSGHTADACWHRYIENYVPQSRHFGRGRGPKSAYMTTWWYLDSGATHHLTNNMANMQVREEFNGSDQLIIGNGQGYSSSHKGYKCLHPSGHLYIARHVTFDELTFPYSTDSSFHCFTESSSSPLSSTSFSPQQIYHLSTLPVVQSFTENSTGYSLSANPDSSNSTHLENPAQPTNDQNSQQVSSQTHLPVNTQHFLSASASDNTTSLTPTVDLPQIQSNIHPMTTRSKSGIFKPKVYAAILTHKETDSVQEALSDSRWVKAMQDEYDALVHNNTWSLVPKETDQQIVDNKWVYRIKYNTDGSVAKYKARLVAKGFQQIAGVNYFETFSPVIKPATIRVVLSLAVMNKWKIRQVDVNNAFLNGDLTEEVYMSQPTGFIDNTKPGYVCKLHKYLYGLKQAPRAWYDKLKSCLLQWGFTNTTSDTSLFLKRSHTSMILVLIYVDDILVTGPSSAELEHFIATLSSTFALKDLGILSYFLGVEVLYDEDCIFLSQRKYIIDLLAKVDMINCKGIDTPLSTGLKLQKSVQGQLGHYLEDPTYYRSIVGSMQYLVLTRPEIAFAVNKLSQYVSAPTLQHLMACKRVLRYLKATQDYGLKFIKEGNMELTGFTDADWACDLDDRKSVSAYCIYLVNYNTLRAKLEDNGSIFNTSSDTVVVLHLIPISKARPFFLRILDVCEKLEGAYSMVFVTEDKLVAVRDPYGFMPLVMGRRSNGALVFASETCALFD